MITLALSVFQLESEMVAVILDTIPQKAVRELTIISDMIVGIRDMI